MGSANTSISKIPDIGLTEIESEPRARDIDLAERLGFSRPRNIRRLIERHRSELEQFGTCSTVERVMRGNDVTEYWLNEEQALLMSILSNAPNAAAVRAMLIRVFVAYRRGHLVEADAPMAELSPAARNAIGGIVKRCASVALREEMQGMIVALLPQAVNAMLAERHLMVRRGRTAQDILASFGFPRGIKGLTLWAGNRMDALGIRMNGNEKADRGDGAIRLYDPDKAETWMRSGGRHLIEQKVAERRGQGRLRLVA
jgi:hypothetical protein